MKNLFERLWLKPEFGEAFKIVLIYLVVSIVWILFSDSLVSKIVANAHEWVYFSILKGWAFVIITSLLLFLLIKKGYESITKERVKASRNEQLYKMVSDNTDEVIFQYNIDSDTISYISTSVKRLLGYEYEEIVGKSLNSIFPNDMINKIRDELLKRKLELEKGDESKRIEKYQLEQNRKNGSFFKAELATYLINDKSGKVKSVIGISKDLSEIKKYEEELTSERNLLRTLIDNLPANIFVKDSKSRFLLNNKSHIKFLGANSQEETFGKTYFEFFPKDIAARLAEDDRKVLEEGMMLVDTELKEVLPSDVVRWTSVTKVPLKNAEGKIVGLVGITNNITERKMAEEEIRRLSEAVEQSPASIIITDTSGGIIYVNKTFEETTGYTLKEVLHHKPSILSSGKTSIEVYKNLWSTITSGQTWRGELLNKKKSGELIWHDSIITPIEDTKNNIINYLGVQMDITERKNIMQQLIEAKEKADESNKTKDLFLANMSHELRTPLIGILGYSDILTEELDDQTYKEMASGINRSGIRLLNTLNLILDLTRIESGKYELNIVEKNIIEDLEFVYKMFRSAALDKKLEYIFETFSEELIVKYVSLPPFPVQKNL